MPFCRVDPLCQLWYEFSTTSGSQPTGKPILFIITPLFHDITCPSVQAYATDRDLLARFDILAYDPRGHGRTQCYPHPKQDAWTAAGDALVLLNRLSINAVHVLGSHAVNSDCALRMAVLSPQTCLSLTLCGVNNQIDTPFFKQALGEVFRHLTQSEVIDDFYEGLAACLFFEYGPDPAPEMADEYAGVFLRRYNPRRSVTGFLAAAWWFYRPPIPDQDLKSIDVPMTILHGSEDVLYPEGPSRMENVFAPRPPTLIPIPGAPHNVFSLNAATVKSVLLTLPVPHANAHTSPPCLSSALQKIKMIASRTPHLQLPSDYFDGLNPNHSNSFSLVSPDRQLEIQAGIDEILTAPEPPFEVPGSEDPERWEVRSNEEPHRTRFSERYMDRF